MSFLPMKKKITAKKKSKIKVLNFDPEIFIEATNFLTTPLSRETGIYAHSCNAIRHLDKFSQTLTPQLSFYQRLFDIEGGPYSDPFKFSDEDYPKHTWDARSEFQQGVRFDCLFLSYLIAKDIDSGKISPLFA
jgi:hypothetical protein